MRRDQISLQLYTVREETARDMPGTLRRISEIGYPAVEFAGYGGLSPQTSNPSSTTSASAPPAPTSPRLLGADPEAVIADMHPLDCATPLFRWLLPTNARMRPP